jgi:hypothetical protein
MAAGLTGEPGRAYRNQVELSMAAAACLLMGETSPEAPGRGREAVTRMFRELLVGAR